MGAARAGKHAGQLRALIRPVKCSMLRDSMEGSRRQALARALARVPSAFWVACVLLSSAALWLDAHRRYPWDLRVLDAMEYGDIARHLANGQGFTTSLVYPAELEFGVSHAHPSLVRPPVWPLLLAGGFALFGVHDWVAHALLGAVQLATLAAAMALAWSLAGRAAGLTAGVAVGASSQILSASMLAGAEPGARSLVHVGLARLRTSARAVLDRRALRACLYRPATTASP